MTAHPEENEVMQMIFQNRDDTINSVHVTVKECNSIIS
jgi:hypothetical protein